MKSGALLAGSKSHTSIHQQQVTNKIICLSGVKTRIQIDGFVSKFLVFSLNDYFRYNHDLLYFFKYVTVDWII